LHDLAFSDLELELVASGLPPVHTRALWRALHRDATCGAVEERDFVPPLRRWLAENCGVGRRFNLDGIDVAEEVSSNDGRTRKLLLRLDDGETIETVVMGYRARFTACLSTQVGCAMARFLKTGQSGAVRHPCAGEIVAFTMRVVCRMRAARGPVESRAHGHGRTVAHHDSVMTASKSSATAVV
jgi:23S rRNA (adenine2503-C2)-methyltransferase